MFQILTKELAIFSFRWRSSIDCSGSQESGGGDQDMRSVRSGPSMTFSIAPSLPFSPSLPLLPPPPFPFSPLSQPPPHGLPDLSQCRHSCSASPPVYHIYPPPTLYYLGIIGLWASHNLAWRSTSHSCSLGFPRCTLLLPKGNSSFRRGLSEIREQWGNTYIFLVPVEAHHEGGVVEKFLLTAKFPFSSGSWSA